MPIVSTGQLTLTDLNDTKQLILYLNPNYRTQVYDPNAGTYTPSFSSTNLIIQPELFVAGGNGSNILPNGGTPVANAQVKSVTWYEGTQTATPIAEGSTTDYTITAGSATSVDKKLTVKTNFTAKNSQIFTCVVVYTDPDTSFDVTLKANVDIVKITNGQKGDGGANAITSFISNQAVTLSATSGGTVGSYANSGTDIFVYDGATALTYTTNTTPANGQFKVAVSASGITAGAISAGTGKAIVAVASAMTADTATITYTITGKSLSGVDINATQIQSFSKAKAGTDGTTPTSYWLVTSADVIQKNTSGTTLPATITITGFSQVGTGTPSSTASFKFVTDTSTDGSTFTNNVASPTGTVASTTFNTNFANLKAVRFRLYRSVDTPSTSNFIDEQIVMVVQDGSNGTDAYYLNVWTPNGDTIRNGVGSLAVQADLYKGGGTVTPTAFKWYIQDPTATTGSGGDADGGNGWRLVNGVADATTAPTLALVANANSKLTVATHYVKYTWLGLSGETIGSTEASLAVTAGNDLRVTIPAFPTNAIGARVYVGTATGNANLKYQGTISTSAGNIVINRLDTNGELIPTATTASTALVTSASITVRPHAIQGVEGIKCVATAPVTGTKYNGVTVVKDMTDPVSVEIIGANIFKNGEGSVTLRAQIMQNGVQLTSTGYTFAWSVYKTDGTLHKVLSGSTDTITVNATDINGIGNVVCDVSK